MNVWYDDGVEEGDGTAHSLMARGDAFTRHKPTTECRRNGSVSLGRRK